MRSRKRLIVFLAAALVSTLVFITCAHLEKKDLVAEAIRSFQEDDGFDRPFIWYADTTHSSIQFKTRHTAVHDVIGWFGRYKVEMTAAKFDFSDAEVTAMADLRSIVMPNMGMAQNLQLEDQFHTALYPHATFTSTKVWHDGPTLKILGNLTIKEITKEIEFTGTMNGFAHPQERGLPGFTIDGKFSRFDFGIGKRDTLRPGNVPMIDDTIHFTANLRFYVRQ